MFSTKMYMTYWTLVAMCTRKRKQMMKEVITQTGSTTAKRKCTHVTRLHIYTYMQIACSATFCTIFCAS